MSSGLPADPPEEEPANILLVDDRPENLLALEAVLEPLGQNLVRATSGEEALKCLLHEDFALILLDVQMPGLDGFETAAHIKQRERTRHIPIIFLTAISGEPHHASRGYSTGAVDYITKPFDAWVLRAKVSVFLELNRKNRELQRLAEATEQQLRERERAEEAAARQSIQLERANAELEAFVETVSHDLSAPLQTSRGLLESVLEDFAGELPDEAPGRINRAARRIEQLQGLVTDLLAYSQAAGEPKITTVDMSALARDCVDACDLHIEEAGAQVLIDPLPTVNGDRALLSTLLQNLISNAVKFRREGVAPRVHIAAERAPRAWRFTVSDNGIGIDPSERQRVFHAFHRPSASEDYPG
ncbi:MAG: sensor histidine kinase, partial [Acidimicrobiia bacterium]